MSDERFTKISNEGLRQRLNRFADQVLRLGYREAAKEQGLFFRDYGPVAFFLDFRNIDERYQDAPRFYWQFKEGQQGTPWRGTVVRRRMVFIEAVRVRAAGVVLDVGRSDQEAELIPIYVMSNRDEEDWHYRYETDDWEHS